MENRIGNKAKRLGARRRLKSIMARIAIAMSGIAIFTVVYVLLVPGLTAEWPLQCELEEHIHDESCYTLAAASGTETVPAGSELICGLEEAEGHSHSDACYTAVCGALVCEDADHEHSDDCYEWTQELSCGAEETEGHSHSAECYSVTEATDGENKPEEIYELTCGLEEHTHQDGCYIIPDSKETYYCDFLTEHTHKDDCYFESGELKCNIPEHLHDDSCLAQPMSIELDECFRYETDISIIDFYISGEATYTVAPGTEDTEATGLEFNVTISEDQDEYDAYEELVSEDGDVLAVEILTFSLRLDGRELDLSNCEVIAELAPTEMVQSYAENGAPQAMTLGIMSGDEEDETGADKGLMLTVSAGDDDSYEVTPVNADDSIRIKVSGYTLRTAVARGANPSFTVQYYANLERAVRSSKGTLPVIDTSGGKLPQNGKGTTTSPNGNSLAYLTLDNGKIKTEKTLTEIYRTEEFEYQKAPGLMYFNIVLKNNNSQYKLDAIWVLKEGVNADKATDNDWIKHSYTDAIHFTNRAETAENDPTNYILIKDGTVIRLVYDTKSVDFNTNANFYDYDISTGLIYRAKPNYPLTYTNYKTAGQTFSGNSLTDEVLTWAKGLSNWDKHLYAYTRESGINSSGNYSGSGTKLAFGNVNTGTNLGNLKWNGNNLNRYNTKNHGAAADTYKGCAFGIAAGLKEDGTIQYASGINAPKLFNEGGATGKASYSDGQYSLDFSRVGDTYTLAAVKGTGATNLDTFNNPTSSTGTHTDIWTNNFWPMDSAPSFGTGTHDVKFGGTATYKGKAHEIRFGPITQKDNDYTFPESDDGQYHNSYFGMQFAVTFELTNNYVGPLEYYFFGDDDMWVFLSEYNTATKTHSNSKLICDIGGVHSSVGEYVNLWDYINPTDLEALDKNEVKQYALTFYYTERGASGSTCWMQFTLPTVVGLDLETELEKELDENNGSLWIEKQVSGIETDELFQFTLELHGVNSYDNFMIRDQDGNVITQGDGTRDFISDGGVFTLKHNQVLVVQKIPIGTEYTITEVDPTGYSPQIDTEVDGKVTSEVVSADKAIAKGTIVGKKGDEIVDEGGDGVKGLCTKVVFTNSTSYELPATGGFGTFLLYASGAVLVLLALILMFNKKTRRKGAAC